MRGYAPHLFPGADIARRTRVWTRVPDGWRRWLAAGALMFFVAEGGFAQEPVIVRQVQGIIDVSNTLVKAVFTRSAGGGIKQAFFAAVDGAWVRVVDAFRPPDPRPTATTALYLDRSNEHGRALRTTDAYRIIVPDVVRTMQILRESPEEVAVLLRGETTTAQVAQIVTMRRGQEVVHIDVVGALQDRPPRLEYLLSSFAIAAPGAPDFSHAPSYKRSPGDVIGDRVFFAPAAIVQKKGLLAALAPDLDQINAHVVFGRDARPQKHRWIFGVPIDSARISMPAVLDLELDSGMTDRPLLAYGIMDVITEQHVFRRHENAGGTLVRTLSDPEVRYGMDLILSADAAPQQGYRRVASHHWSRYGTRYLQRPRPQAMPFAEYAEVSYPASFAYNGYTVEQEDGLPVMTHRDAQGPAAWNSWRQWETDGEPMGALRLSAPQWFHLAYNTAWRNIVADATGFYYWGQRLGDPSLLDKARRVINLSLSAPQKEGLFPSLYDLQEKRWLGSLWRFPTEGYDPDETRTYWNWENGDCQTASASVTAGYLMEVHRLFEQDPRIVAYVRRYGEFLIDHMQPDGSVPAWYDQDLEPRPSMRWNADGGAHAWVLSELYRATGEERFLSAAERSAQFLLDEVLPQQKWIDFEALYSCARKAETFYDTRTGQPPRNAMSMSWALQGFISLHEVTGKALYLEAVADYASFFQTVWAPHYIITAYPFGGFSSQIGDAEWLDQRDHRFAGILARLGLHAGRQDLIERGVAAARASLALLTHPRHMENQIYNAPTFPLGLGPENIDHEGFAQTPLRSGPSWAEVGGLAAAADVLRLLGGLYVNVERDLAVGVDGLAVKDFSLRGRTLSIEIGKLLAALPLPYGDPYEVELRVDGLPDERTYSVLIGDDAPLELTAKDLVSQLLTIRP